MDLITTGALCGGALASLTIRQLFSYLQIPSFPIFHLFLFQMDFVTTAIVLGGALATLLTQMICSYLENWDAIGEFEKVRPVLRHPQAPEILKDTETYRVEGKDEYRQIGLTLGKKDVQYASSEALIFIQDFLSKFHPKENQVVPKNCLAVSMCARRSFRIGSSAHEFVLRSGTMPEGAFFSYQMLSAHLQATFFNLNGIAHLAGMCLHLPSVNEKFLVWREDQLIRIELLTLEEYPVRNRYKQCNFITCKQYGRFCSSAGKRVLVELCDDGQIVHSTPNAGTRRMDQIPCAECAEDHKNYKFVPPVVAKAVKTEKVVEKKAVPAAVPVPEVVKDEKSKEEKKEEAPKIDTDEDKEDFDFCNE